MTRALAFLMFGLLVAVPPNAVAQRRAPAISSDSLRAALFALAHDSMGGRQTGEIGDWKAQEWIAARFQRFGLRPAGDNGTYFQIIPFVRVFVDTSARISAGAASLAVGRDILPLGAAVNWSATGVQAVFGGWVNRPDTWVDSATAAGRLLVLAVPDSARDFRAIFATLGPSRQSPAGRAAAGAVLVVLDRIAPDIIPQILAGRITTDTSTTPPPGVRPLWVVTPAAARALLGGTVDVAAARSGTVGGALAGTVRLLRTPLAYPARNVVAILPGSDPALKGQYVSMSAHHDHVGYTGRAVDHDSTFAFNRVVRPLGADSPMRPATVEEGTRVTALRDSLRASRGGSPRPDSVFNGADDDGSGTVAILEVARTLAAGPAPRRSVLFVSHAAEERGLLGSAWYSDHPTVPRDSIVGEVDLDMVGRGNKADLPQGGPGYLEVIGVRRLSKEYGDLLEQVNSRLPQPFTFNYEYDAPGHPLQYYCRADHYSYARYGIPAVAMSRGEHADYHQVTDEPAYIDYNALARVATLARSFAVALADLGHRPLVDGPVQSDPHAPCRQ
ncbi:MAG TPA: M28 family peptidase [Gemmatimonadales bacterium]|nr:M28 family peptidase [Gemmatimonadales bacterium]